MIQQWIEFSLNAILREENFAELTFATERSDIGKFRRSNVCTWTIYSEFYRICLRDPVALKIVWQRKQQNIASKNIFEKLFCFRHLPGSNFLISRKVFSRLSTFSWFSRTLVLQCGRKIPKINFAKNYSHKYYLFHYCIVVSLGSLLHGIMNTTLWVKQSCLSIH